MNHVVLLAGDHPGLRRHLAETVGESAIHAVGIATVLERPGGEPRRGRQRARLVLGSVTVGTDAVVDRLTALELLWSLIDDHPSVVEVALVIGQGGRRSAGSGRSARARAGPCSAISMR